MKKTPKKVFFSLFLFAMPLFGQWQMFADKTDTYIYNTVTGEIYVRLRSNGKNYEDFFVKMPKGVIPKNSKDPSFIQSREQTTQAGDEETKKSALKAVKKANEMMNHAVEGGL